MHCHSRLLVKMLSERWHYVSSRLTRAEVYALPGIDIPHDVQDDIATLVSELDIRCKCVKGASSGEYV